jgi:homopolymeric O-antigen transport system permease protein
VRGTRRSGLELPAPFAPLLSAWRHRRLIVRLARRDVESRYRGSLLGIAWSVVTPLLLLGIYTFVFSVVLKARWGAGVEGRGQYALVLFSGLLTYGVFSDCVNRAPGLVLQHVAYVKKVVFPLEILPWVSLLGALFNAAVGSVVLLAAYVAVRGAPPASSLVAPLLLIPLCLLSLGVAWLLSAAGVFLRDLGMMVPVLTMALLFLSPVFFPAAAVPEPYRTLMSLNPVTPAVESVRAVLFFREWPQWREWIISLAISGMACWLGFAWFANTRRGFADVL